MKRMTGTMFVLLALACPPLFTQPAVEKQSSKAYLRNCIYFELLGTGILYSVNYEHRFAEHVSVRMGFTKYSIPIFPVPETNVNVLGFPVLLSYLAGSGGHYFEMGAGALIFNMGLNFFALEGVDQKKSVLGAGVIGYRYQPMKGGFLFRITLTPLTRFSRTVILGGLSLGILG
jgi:hypothetical protein